MFLEIIKDRPNQLVFTATLCLMCLIFGLEISSDFVVHAFYIQWFAEGKNILPANFLYYVVVYLLSGFSRNFTLIMGATALAAAIFTTLKFQVTRLFLKHFTQLNAREILALSTALILVMSLPSLEILRGGKSYFLPQLPPNTWHNSTLVCLFPFAIALFWVSFESIFNQNQQNWLFLTGLIILNLLIKPSYFLVLIMAYPLAWVWFKGFSILTKKSFWVYMLPLILGLLILSIQQHFLYNDTRSVYYLTERTEGSILIKPFHVWQGHTKNIPMSFILSLAFPIYIFIVWGKKLFQSKLMQYLLISSFFSLSIYILISETHEHTFAKNYSWQLYITNYLLFALGGAFVLEKIKNISLKSLEKKDKIALVLFALHVFSGVAYLLKMLITKSYK
jgi:hypothetical protein